jgi:hypothetical protein
MCGHRQEHVIEMKHQETKCEGAEWFHLIQDRI